MSKKFAAAVFATAAIGVVSGFGYCQHVEAADAADLETQVGGGAPTKVLIENERVRISLTSYPQGFKRDGGQRRQYDQVIVWVDEGDYTVVRPAGAPPNPNAGARGPESAIALDGSVVTGKHPQGTVVWHPKNSRTPKMVVNKPYRQFYIEIKS